MLKKIVLLLSLILTSCNNSQQENKKTTGNFINFDTYRFNTIKKTKEKISLNKGKKYVLDFWYLECAPCVKQHKLIKEYQNQLLDNNVEIIGISIDKNAQNWKNYLAKNEYHWQNYNQFKGDYNLKNDLDIKIFPTYFIIDYKGNIEKKFNAFKNVLAYFNINSPQ